MLQKITEFINGGNVRSVKTRKNIILSFGVKGISMIIGFLMIRIVLDYLDQVNYGIWLTLSSFLTWFTFFEIGLGSGLRNKLAEALALKNYKLAKNYVSTTYFILTIIILIISLLFFTLNYFIDWTLILNVDDSMSKVLNNLALIVFGLFFIQFVFKLITVILYADQRPALANSIGPLGNLISLLIIYTLTKTTNGSLIYLGIALSIVPIFVLTCFSIFLYQTDYKKIRPSFRYVKIKYAHSLMSLGAKFFIIQISALILFQSSNIIIAQYFGPAEVTAYNIAYKYFGIINMIFAIIMIPHWSAFTDAWVKKEIFWIKSTIRKLQKIWILLTIFSIVLLLISTFAFEFWIGKSKMEDIIIPISLKYSLSIFFLLFTYGGIFNMFINGTGKVKVQMVSLLLGSLIFVPLSILLIKYSSLGISSVVVSSIIANFYLPIIAPIQYNKLISGKAVGLWNK